MNGFFKRMGASVLVLALLATCFTASAAGALEASTTSSEVGASVLTLTRGIPNPAGNLDEVYILRGRVGGPDIVIDDSLVRLPEASDDAPDVLHIFHINDLHSNIMKFNAKGDTHVLAQMKRMLDDCRASLGENEAMLFVSAGDDHIGASIDELLGNSYKEFKKSAVYIANSAAGMDFAALGNHEFDKYTPTLVSMIRQDAKFCVLSSNIQGSQYDLPTAAAAIGVAKGLRIGVIGLTIPTETALHTALDPTIDAMEPKEALTYLVPALDPYCDVIVVLSHNGYEASDRYSLSTGDADIAELLGGLTTKPAVVVGGHTHEALNPSSLESANVYAGVPVVQAGQYGEYLGEVNIDMSGDAPAYTAQLHPVLSGKATTDGTPYESANDYDAAYQSSVIDPLYAELEEKLQEVIAQTEDNELVSDERNILDRYIGECAFANFMNDAIVARSRLFNTGSVDFSIFNSTGIRGLPIGSAVTFQDIYSMLPYADTISIVRMTGQDLKDILENNAARVIPKEAFLGFGGDTDPVEFVETGFIHFSSGVRYTIVPGETPDKNTIKDVTLNGEDIDSVLDQTYAVAVSSYLAIGRGGWQGAAVGQGIPESFTGYDLQKLCAENGHDLGLVFRNELIEYIKGDASGSIGAATGVVKDGRLTVIGQYTPFLTPRQIISCQGGRLRPP